MLRAGATCRAGLEPGESRSTRAAASQDQSTRAICCKLASAARGSSRITAGARDDGEAPPEDLTDGGLRAELQALAKMSAARKRRLAEIYAAGFEELPRTARRARSSAGHGRALRPARRRGRRAAVVPARARVRGRTRAPSYSTRSTGCSSRKEPARAHPALPRGARLPEGRGPARRPPRSRAWSGRAPRAALAIETYRAALDVDEDDAQALDADGALPRARPAARLADLYRAGPRRPGRRAGGAYRLASRRSHAARGYLGRDRSARGDRRRGCPRTPRRSGARGAHPGSATERRGSSRSPRGRSTRRTTGGSSSG